MTAACCSSSRSEFAVLALLSCPDGETLAEQDGVILLFDAENPKPVSSWSVKKVCLAELLYSEQSIEHIIYFLGLNFLVSDCRQCALLATYCFGSQVKCLYFVSFLCLCQSVECISGPLMYYKN